jgi:hypothetical protein
VSRVTPRAWTRILEFGSVGTTYHDFGVMDSMAPRGYEGSSMFLSTKMGQIFACSLTHVRWLSGFPRLHRSTTSPATSVGYVVLEDACPVQQAG